MWNWLRQQQQRGTQLPRPGDQSRAAGKVPGEAPSEATVDRSAQDHEQAGGPPQSGAQAGEFPASPLENRDQDITPSAPGDRAVEWDDVVQPQPGQEQGQSDGSEDLPLPEGK